MKFFVTGTDTDAGKTHAACALLRAARIRGLTCESYKPIESGCPVESKPGRDACALAVAAGSTPRSTYMFTPPIAPHVAARQAGLSINLESIAQQASAIEENSEFFLVEGAGGLVVPICDDKNFSHLAARLEYPVIIVAADRLGAMNHTLLTLEAARSRNLPIACVVLSETTPGSGRGLDNHGAIAHFGDVTTFSLPYRESADASAEDALPIVEHLRQPS